MLSVSAVDADPAAAEGAASRPPAAVRAGTVPLDWPASFVPYQGYPADASRRYTAEARGYEVRAFDDRIEWVRTRGGPADVVTMRWAGGRAVHPQPRGAETGRFNYYVGGDPAAWREGLPGFDGLRYVDVRPGIDLVLRADGGQVAYDIEVRPGGDLAGFWLEFGGSASLRVNEAQALVVETAGATFEHAAPVVYQARDGVRETVPGRFELAGRRLTFRVAEFDPALTLVIDPAVTVIGHVDVTSGLMAHDVTGIYIAGTSRVNDSTWALRVRKTSRNPPDTQNFFTSFVCAPGEIWPYALLAQDPDHEPSEIWVGGTAGCWGGSPFPASSDAGRTVNQGWDGFVMKLSGSSLAMLASTLVGGSGSDDIVSLERAMEPMQPWIQVYFAGSTTSTDIAGSSNSPHGGRDAFWGHVYLHHRLFSQSSYLGGTGDDWAAAILRAPYLDGQRLFVAGSSNSPDFGGRMHDPAGGYDAFVFDTLASGARFVGGTGDDRLAAAILAGGSIALAGNTTSDDFPLVRPVHTGGTSVDAFVALVDPATLAPTFSTLLGGSGVDEALELETNWWWNESAGRVFTDLWVGGTTESSDFPVTHPSDSTLGGRNDVFLTRIAFPSTGPRTAFSSLIGGSASEWLTSMFSGSFRASPTARPTRQLWVSGRTGSSDFAAGAASGPPVSPDSSRTFLARVDYLPTITGVEPLQGPAAGGTPVRITGRNFTAGTTVQFGGRTATVTGLSETTIDVLSPTGVVGEAATIRIDNPDGDTDSFPDDPYNGYRFTGPKAVVTSVTPTSAPVAGGGQVLVRGSGFVNGLVLRLGNQVAQVLSVLSDAILATIPPGSAGYQSVTVTNPWSPASTDDVRFTYVGPDPVVTIVDPPVTSTLGGARLLIAGSNFVEGIQVTIGGAAAHVVRVLPNLLDVEAPARPAGPAVVGLTNPGDTAVSLSGLLTYSALAPAVARVVPFQGPVAGGTLVTLIGANFLAGQTTVTFGGQPLTAFTVLDGSHITFETPRAAIQSTHSFMDVKVSTPNGTFHSSRGFFYQPDAFTVPTITSVTPSRGTAAGGTKVTIVTTASDAWVFFGGVPATDVEEGFNTLVATTPPHAAGPVDVLVSAGGGTVTRVGGFTYETPAPFKAPDFDGDLTTDVSVYRPSTGQWFVLGSASGFKSSTVVAFGGQAGDVPLAGDFDGDGKRDFAVYRPSTGTWFWTKSSTPDPGDYDFRGWGVQARGDAPVPGDYDGDGKTDPAVFRAVFGTWFVLRSSSGYATYFSLGWGQFGDVAVPGDYDGDRITDIAVYRPSTGQWFVRTSSSNFTGGPAPIKFGENGDVPVHGDFDGDGRKDVAVYRPPTGTWFVLKSSTDNTSYDSIGWGVQAQGDVPVPGDYDGDGITDVTVYRPQFGTWFVLKSSTGNTQFATYGWGAKTDTPLGGQR